MSEEDLELLITLDDPEGAPKEDLFNHAPSGNTAGYFLDQTSRERPRPATERQQEPKFLDSPSL